jgi:menaquinol-cytochrome c reductase iron-sulfur subunit
MLNEKQSRRGFIHFFTYLILALIAVVVAIPVLGYFLSPVRRKVGGDGTEGSSFSDVGPVADFPVGQWRLVTLEVVQEDGWKKTRVKHSAWIRRQEAGKATSDESREGITVLSAICPHLGCPINWHPNQSEFICPCHGGVFSSDGQHTGGPPPRNMDPLKFEVRQGRLWVRWQDFKIGVAEKIPVNV